MHQADKLIERTRRVTHCKERMSHVISIARIVSGIRAIELSLIVEKPLGPEADQPNHARNQQRDKRNERPILPLKADVCVATSDVR
jgi:hypothetical protein